MSRIWCLLAVCLAAATNADAGFSQTQDFRPPSADELALRDVPSAPGASAVILDWVRVDDDVDSFSAEYFRIKVLTDAGRKYADVEVPYVAGHSDIRVTDISARTIQPDGTIVPYDGKVYDKLLYKAGGVRVQAKTFTLSGVLPGSILEYRYQLRWPDTLLMSANWSIQRDIPILRARMTFRPHTRNEYGSFFTYHNMPPGKVPVQTASRSRELQKSQYDLELTDIPPFQEEELAPPEDSLKPRVNFHYTTSRVDPAKFWSVQATEWNKSIESFLSGGALHQQANALRGKDPGETLQNVYAKVQSFRNLSFESDPTAAEKKNAAAVVAAAEGFRAEINRAFVALARAAGLDAMVVRVAPRDKVFFSPHVPDAGQMDAEIAAVTIEGQTRFFDPGTPGAPLGTVSWEKSNVPGVRIGKGAGNFETVAAQRPEDAVLGRTAELRLEGDVLQGSVVATFTGQEALRRRVAMWGDEETAQKKTIEDEAVQWFPAGASVKLTQLRGVTSYAEPLVAKFDVTLGNLVSATASRTVLPVSVFATGARNPFAAATRAHAIYFHYPRREEDDVKITFPDTLAAGALPTPARLDAGSFKYTNETTREGNTIRFTRTLTVDAMLIEPQHYRAVRNFFSAAVAADQKPLLLGSK